MIKLGPLGRRRWRNFRRNNRAYWSLIIFSVLFFISLFAEILANDKPIIANYKGKWHYPIVQFYPETAFGGEFQVEAVYRDPEVQCLIISGGLDACWDDPTGVIEDAADGMVDGQTIEKGWIIQPLIPFHFRTANDLNYRRALYPDEEHATRAPSPPDGTHWLGTDDRARDVLARVIYGFRLSVFFALIVTFAASVIGILAGAVQGYFGGWTDLIFQRILEIWSSTPSLYIIIIVAAIWTMDFWLLATLTVLFGWPALVGVVRAEFLRARNFEYVRAARALGVSDFKIMIKHVLPNAMVATVTFLPFLVTGAISTLASLDFLGFGLPSTAPSLGELTLQAKQNLQAPWLGITAFIVFAIMLSLLVFIFEGVRDAFDPRKIFVDDGNDKGDDSGDGRP